MFRIIIIISYLLACFFFGAWKNWGKYYSTILYVIIGDLAYNFVFYNFLLWEYKKLASHTINDLLYVLIVFPCSIILFLTYYPSKLKKQILYVLVWSGFNTTVEFISSNMGYLSYHNGWNIVWSFGFYIIAFSLIRLHYKHPLIVWPISLGLAAMTVIIFGLPFHLIK